VTHYKTDAELGVGVILSMWKQKPESNASELRQIAYVSYLMKGTIL
jgi:hypothetical protein